VKDNNGEANLAIIVISLSNTIKQFGTRNHKIFVRAHTCPHVYNFRIVLKRF
jgi:hypothetical protein